jgi:hypothetical protein
MCRPAGHCHSKPRRVTIVQDQVYLGLYPSASAAADAHDLAILVHGGGNISELNKGSSSFSGYEELKQLSPEEFVAKLVNYSTLQYMRVPRTKGVYMSTNNQFEARFTGPVRSILPSRQAVNVVERSEAGTAPSRQAGVENTSAQRTSSEATAGARKTRDGAHQEFAGSEALSRYGLRLCWLLPRNHSD